MNLTRPLALLALTLAVGAISCSPTLADLIFHKSVPPKRQKLYTKTLALFPAQWHRVDLNVAEGDCDGKRGGWWHAYPGFTGPYVRLAYDFQSTFAHEYGHHVHATMLPGEHWQEWMEWWRQNRAKLPSDYARENAPEGFAECVRVLYYGRKVHPEIREMFTRWGVWQPGLVIRKR